MVMYTVTQIVISIWKAGTILLDLDTGEAVGIYLDVYVYVWGYKFCFTSPLCDVLLLLNGKKQ